MKNLLYTTMIVAIATMSCRSIEKMVDQGRYDDAIHFATEKLAGKKNKKTKHIQALEEAFVKVNNQEIDRIAFLIGKNDPGNWDDIYDLYSKIEWRQNRISGFLPLISKDGYVADFAFVNTNEGLLEASEAAMAFHYSNGNRLLETAIATNDKLIARNAFVSFERIKKYNRNYKDAPLLMTQAHALGVVNVLVRMDEGIARLIPQSDTRLLTNVYDNNEVWISYHLDHSADIPMDMASTLYLNEFDISPEREQVNNLIERRQIETWIDQTDRKGNVVRDSAGNAIQYLQVENVEARIQEILRSKSLRMNGYMETVDYATGNIIDNHLWDAYVDFASDACTFNGDRRALGDNTRKRIDQRLERFPRDSEMIEEAIYGANENFLRRLRRLELERYVPTSLASAN